jgi:rhodanese-related sulfurtransferase
MSDPTVTAIPSTIDTRTLREWLTRGDDVTIVDVRTPAEFESTHILGSYNLPLDLLEEHRAELRHLTHPVVLVCRSGQRAVQAERQLIEVGLPNVKVLDGGILAWQAAGAEVRRGRQRWDLERQVRLVAGSLVLTGVLASVAFAPAKWLAAAAGAGLTFAALSNTCALGLLLGKLPYNRGASCDVGAVVARLAESAPGGRVR